jgi:F420-dependent oxidoreductase-like protein
MKLGLTCSRFTWSGGDAAIAEKFATVARSAEEAGLDSLWVMAHYWQIKNFGAPEEPMLEAYSALTYAAALTRRITLGTLVTSAIYREPGFLLKQVSTLDALSGGRAVLGLGAGWYEQEARGLGFGFPPVAERFERLEETLQIAQQMWRDEENPYKGRHYTLERTLNSPQALTKPHPPIMIGGSGEKKTLRLVAQYGDACNLFDGADVRHKFGVLRDHCERLARPYEAIEKTLHLRITDDQTVGQSVRRCSDFAALGIDHIIVAVPDAADEATLAHLAELGSVISAIIPAGR